MDQSNTYNSEIVVKAIDFATRYHKLDVRKGTHIPYLNHLFNVAALLAEAGCDDEIVAAGLLHDVIEDTDASRSDVLEHFGDRITEIVVACTEKQKLEKKTHDERMSWKHRKLEAIEELRHCSPDSRQVKIADKLDNIRAIRNDYEKLGDAVWERFNAGKQEQRWYYRSMVEALRGMGHANKPLSSLYTQFYREVHKVFPDLLEDDEIRIMIANDHQIFRMGVKMALERISNFKVIEEATDFRDTLERVQATKANFLILDDIMPGGSIREALPELKKLRPDLKIIVTSIHAPDAPHMPLIKTHADGLLGLAASSNHFIEAIQNIHMGGCYYFIAGHRRKKEKNET